MRKPENDVKIGHGGLLSVSPFYLMTPSQEQTLHGVKCEDVRD